MLIVAVRALHQAFIYAVMEGFLKLRLSLKVAGIAERWLAVNEKELSLFGMMWRMAIRAGYVVGLVSRTLEITVFFAILMALQTLRRDFFGRRALEDEDLRFVATPRNVVCPGAVACFTTLKLHPTFGVQGCLPVRSLFKRGVDFVVAGLAHVGSNVFAGIDLGTIFLR